IVLSRANPRPALPAVTVVGDATDAVAVKKAVSGADAVVTLVAAPQGAEPGTVRSDATRTLLEVLETDPVPHLVAVSALGGRDSRDRQSRLARWVYARAVGPERLAEVDRQEDLIREADVVATVVRPPRLDNGPSSGYRFVTGKAGASIRLHRADLARLLADLATGPVPAATRFLIAASK